MTLLYNMKTMTEQKSAITWVVDNNLVVQIGPSAMRVEYIDGKLEVVRDAIELTTTLQ